MLVIMTLGSVDRYQVSDEGCQIVTLLNIRLFRFVTARESGASEFAKKAIIDANFDSAIKSVVSKSMGKRVPLPHP